jgi:two-component system nitrogen regulation response regulator GlnG/two-component system response regulator HydG
MPDCLSYTTAVSKSHPRKAPLSDATTGTHEGWLAARSSDEAGLPPVYALALAWSLVEPERTGEVALLGNDCPALILGRGGSLPDDEAPRVRFVRHRAGRVEARPPLGAPGLSRRQVLLRPSPAGIAFERVGRRAVRLNGLETDAGVLCAGDVLTLHNQLVLVCTRRATSFPFADETSATPFGAADRDGIVGESEAAWRLRGDLAHAAASDAHVLVLGESGTGKELAARAVHRRSSRSERPFVSRSAAAIPPTLIDAELFGNRRDYPNTGMPEREGVVGAAHRGTLFLDEIGELAPELQTHLLRLLDSGGEYHRLGEATSRRSDLRFVAATNRRATDLKHDFAARFPVRVTLPGLDARPEDVPLLARYLLEEAALAQPQLRERFFEISAAGAPFARLDPCFIEALLRWPWTTHVRELRAFLWASIRSSTGHFLTTPPEMAGAREEPAPHAVDANEPSARAIREALARHAGNQSKAYAELGLPSRFALYRLMRKHGIDAREPERKR